MPAKKMSMGLIVGNRGFFPDHLAKSGREEMLRVLQAAGVEVIALTPEESKYGAVETREESRRCADLFKRQRERIDGSRLQSAGLDESRQSAADATGRQIAADKAGDEFYGAASVYLLSFSTLRRGFRHRFTHHLLFSASTTVD